MAWTQIGSTTSSATVSGYSDSRYREILLLSKNSTNYVAQAICPALSSGSVDAFYITGGGDKRTVSFNMGTKVLSSDNTSYQAILYAR